MNFFYYILGLLLLSILLAKVTPKHTYVNRLTTPILWMTSAILIGVIFIPTGFIYQLVKSLIKLRKRFFTIMIDFVGEFLYCLFWLIGRIGVCIDLLGNVCGEFLADIITDDDNNHFGESNMTISGSLGDLQMRHKLNKKGIWLVNLVNKIFKEDGAGHCINSYIYWKKVRSKV